MSETVCCYFMHGAIVSTIFLIYPPRVDKVFSFLRSKVLSWKHLFIFSYPIYTSVMISSFLLVISLWAVLPASALYPFLVSSNVFFCLFILHVACNLALAALRIHFCTQICANIINHHQSGKLAHLWDSGPISCSWSRMVLEPSYGSY